MAAEQEISAVPPCSAKPFSGRASNLHPAGHSCLLPISASDCPSASWAVMPFGAEHLFEPLSVFEKCHLEVFGPSIHLFFFFKYPLALLTRHSTLPLLVAECQPHRLASRLISSIPAPGLLSVLEENCGAGGCVYLHSPTSAELGEHPDWSPAHCSFPSVVGPPLLASPSAPMLGGQRASARDQPLFPLPDSEGLFLLPQRKLGLLPPSLAGLCLSVWLLLSTSWSLLPNQAFPFLPAL